MTSAFGGGIQKLFMEMPAKKKRFVSFIIYLIAFGLLLVYAILVLYNMTGINYIYRKLGIVTLCATVMMDFVLYMLYKSHITDSSSMLAVTAILNRALLFIFGGDYWIYGYFALYIYYGSFLSKEIGKKRFPFENAFLEINLDNVA